MAKRLSVTIGIILVIAFGLMLALIPDSRSTLMGFFQSKDFYKGKHKDEWIKELKDSNSSVRGKAYRSLTWVEEDGSNPVPILLAALKDSDAVARAQGAQGLGVLGTRAKETIPDLQQALSDKSDTVRAAAAEALGKMGPDAKVAIPDLIKLLDDQSYPKVIRWAAAALASFGPEAKDAVPALVRNLKSKDPEIVNSCGQALLKIDHDRAIKEGVQEPLKLKALTAPTPG
jgi:HEAT repeat protein